MSFLGNCWAIWFFIISLMYILLDFDLCWVCCLGNFGVFGGIHIILTLWVFFVE
jgi:hypothetical protein